MPGTAMFHTMVNTMFGDFMSLDKKSEEEVRKQIDSRLKRLENPPMVPYGVIERADETPNGTMFYLNEGGKGPIVFHIHGGAYYADFYTLHWEFLVKLVERTDATVIVPGFRLIPYGTYKEAFDLILPAYEACTKLDRKLVVMGDSSGGGMAAALALAAKEKGLRLPDELIMISPWVDAALENPDIAQFEEKDLVLPVAPLKVFGKYWAGDLDVRDPKVSPIYGDYASLDHVTVFIGTNEILNPDAVKFFEGLDASDTNELVVGEGMAHVFPMLLIPEAEAAQEKIFEKVLR